MELSEELISGGEKDFFGKIAKIESGLYENGEEKLKEYVNENYANCKICYVCLSVNYLKFSKLAKDFNSESIFLLSDDEVTKKHLSNVKNVVENSSLIVCLDNESVDFAKFISSVCAEECLFYFSKMPTLDVFLPIRKSEKNELIFVYAKPIKNYVICYFPPSELNREELVDSVFSCLAYLCVFLEKVISSILFKEKFSEQFKEDFAWLVQSLNEFLHQIYFMPENFLDNYLVFLEDFAKLLVDNCEDFNTKENVFANVFLHFDNKTELSMSEIRVVGAQSFCRIYLQFVKDFDAKNLSYFDLQKKLELIEANFEAINFELEDYSQIDLEKNTYLLSRYKSKLQKKIQSFVKMFEQILNNALDLYNDSGFTFSKNFNQEVALKAIYFTPDFLKGESLLKIVRDFGILDYL